MTAYLFRETDHLGQIQAALRGLTGYHSLGFELIQNANDAGAASMVFDLRNDALIIEDDARFSECRRQDLSDAPGARSMSRRSVTARLLGVPARHLIDDFHNGAPHAGSTMDPVATLAPNASPTWRRQ
jgi:predicted lactoylglutathione lyase